MDFFDGPGSQVIEPVGFEGKEVMDIESDLTKDDIMICWARYRRDRDSDSAPLTQNILDMADRFQDTLLPVYGELTKVFTEFNDKFSKLVIVSPAFPKLMLCFMKNTFNDDGDFVLSHLDTNNAPLEDMPSAPKTMAFFA